MSIALRKNKKAKGICIQCSYDTEPGKRLCIIHLVMARERAKKYYYNNKLKINEYHKTRYQKKKLQKTNSLETLRE